MLPGRILVVDDVADVRLLVRTVLEQDGHLVTEAASGAEALTAMAASPPDAVVLDLLMPGLSGMDVLEHMQADPRLRAIPAVVVTAVDDESMQISVLDAGAHDYLVKPFTLSAPIARVRSALRTAMLLQDLRHRNAELASFAAHVVGDMGAPLRTAHESAVALSRQARAAGEISLADGCSALAIEVERAHELVDGLLRMARWDAIVPPSSDEQADLGAVLDRLRTDRRLSEDELTHAGCGHHIAALTPDLATAFAELVDNAIQHGAGADGRVRITVTGEVVGSLLRVRLTDEGPGIPDDEARRVFEPFWPGERARAAHSHSTGVGLTVARNALERWGGRLRCDHAAGQTGARFEADLPLARADADAEHDRAARGS